MGYLTGDRWGFLDTSDDHEELVLRPKDVQDNATLSGSAIVTNALFKLGAYIGEARYVDAAEAAVSPLQPALSQAPTGFAWWLCALEFELAPPKEIAIVGDNAQALLNVVFDGYHPNQVVAYAPQPTRDSAIPLLGDRPQIEGKATAYVCVNFACQMPVTEAEGLAAQLNG